MSEPQNSEERPRRRTLFEMLGIADQERIHTQVLAWLLMPLDSPLTNEQRATLLNKLFAIDASPQDADKIRVITELNRLDLVILHPTAFIAVEIKMKSRQGKDQLLDYNNEICVVKAALGTATIPNKLVKVLLTVSGEVPEHLPDGSIDSQWKSLDYKLVLEALKASTNGSPLSSEGYVADYILLLDTLLKNRDEFVKNHSKYQRVFQRSGWKNLDRLNKPLPTEATPLEQFVCNNKLERLFVERLYREAVTKAGFECFADFVKCVGETHGVAQIHVGLFRVKFADCQNLFNAGFQLQGNTVKLNIGAEKYYDSKCDWFPNAAIKEFDKLFKALACSKNIVLRRNPPRTRAYRSWSAQIDSNNQPQKMVFDAFYTWLKSEIECAKATWENILKSCKESKIVEEFHPLNVMPPV